MIPRRQQRRQSRWDRESKSRRRAMGGCDGPEKGQVRERDSTNPESKDITIKEKAGDHQGRRRGPEGN